MCSQSGATVLKQAINLDDRSFGWDVVKRILSIPGTCAISRTSSAKSLLSVSVCPYEFTFCPRSVTSWMPRSASASTSRSISVKERLSSRPRRCGTTQYEQKLLHPCMIVTYVLTAPGAGCAGMSRERTLSQNPVSETLPPDPSRLATISGSR